MFINDKKYSCESCIKGHRSSSCAHRNRPLFEVKKKGRPVSQCEKCRELRKSKRLHSKCECSIEKEEKPEMKQFGSSTKRYMPILPALPNGLKDVLPEQGVYLSSPSSSAMAMINDETVPRPCSCKDKRGCKCNSVTGIGCTSGLDVLAIAAAKSCCSISVPRTTSPVVAVQPPSQNEIRSCCSSSSTKPSAPDHGSCWPPSSSHAMESGLSLPPILEQRSFSFSSPPLLPDIPPLTTFISLAGTGCTCGLECRCPGCVEHRGPQHASKDHNDCSDGCHFCVDSRQGIELPTSTGYGSASVPGMSTGSTSFINALIARAAAAIPPPPTARSFMPGISLDPMNVTVYPQSLFADEGRRLDEQGPAFGLVQLPKLQCCAGKCGCPGDSCGCGENCDGSCSSHQSASNTGKQKLVDIHDNVGVPRRSCCSSS